MLIILLLNYIYFFFNMSYIKVKRFSTIKNHITKNIHVKYKKTLALNVEKLLARLKFSKCKSVSQGKKCCYAQKRSCHKNYSCEVSKLQHSLFKRYQQGRSFLKICSTLRSSSKVRLKKLQNYKQDTPLPRCSISEVSKVYFRVF